MKQRKPRQAQQRPDPAPDAAVESVLRHYAERGVFRGFSRVPAPPDKALFRVLWHRGQVFECTTDAASARIEFPVVLPGVPSGSSMYAELRAYVASRQSSAVPEHRRIDPAAVRIRCRNRRSQAGLTAEVRNGDYEYAAKKLVHLVHEIYLDFLADGRYYDYMVETFDLDPDHM